MADKAVKLTLAEKACRRIGERVAYNPPTSLNDTAISVFKGEDGRTGILLENFDGKKNYQCIIDGENPKAYKNNKIETGDDPELLRKIVKGTDKRFGNNPLAKISRGFVEALDNLRVKDPRLNPFQ